MSTPSLTSHNSNSSSSFSSSSSVTAVVKNISTITDIIESPIETTKSPLGNIIKDNDITITKIESLILTPTITTSNININEYQNIDDNQQNNNELNDFDNITIKKNLLNYQNNDINDIKLLTTSTATTTTTTPNKIINKKRRNCSNLFDIITDDDNNIKNDRNLIKNIKSEEENIIIIDNIKCLQTNNNNNTDKNIIDHNLNDIFKIHNNNDIDQIKLLEINSNKKFIINNNNNIDNKNIESTSTFNNNSPNSNSCNSNSSTSSSSSNINSSSCNNSITNSNSNSSSSSGGSILAQTNASSATISSGLLSSSTTTTLSPLSGCNSNTIITSNNNNNLINNKQQKVNICSLFNISDHKQDNKINVNFNLNTNNNNSKSIRNIINTKINNITEQMNIKEESTGNLLDNAKAQIKIEDEPPPSQSPICHTPIMSDINIKKESKNISSPSSSSSSSNGNNGNSDLPKNNTTNIIGSTNTGSTLHSSGGGGDNSGPNNSSCSIGSTDNKKSDGNSTDDMLSSKDDIISDNNTEMNIITKKEEPTTDLSTDGFSPLCTSHSVGGSTNNGNGNIQPILNTTGGTGQSGNNGNSIVNPTSSSSICSNNNNNSSSTCGITSNSRGGKRMGISPPDCGIQSLTSSSSMSISGGGSGNGNTVGGSGGGGGNNGNGGNNNNNNKQSMGNNGGLGSVDYMQQQNHIFVFSTQLANKGAESVLTGQYPTIIAYHCAQPTTKKFLEDFFLKNPMKLSKMNRQNSINSQWMQQQQQNLSNNNSHKLIQNKQNNNNISSINTNNNNNSNRISTSNKSSISTSSSTLSSNLQSTNTSNSFVNDELTGNDTDILSWEQNANHLGLDNLQNGSNLDSMDDDGANGIVSRESPTQNVTVSTGNNRNQTQSSTTTSIHQQQSPTMLTSNSLTGPTSPSLSCLQPSLQGVKVPDENLTPQQRQHREEQLAKLKKMNQFLFPEHTTGIGPDFINAIPTDNSSTDQSLIGGNNIVGNVITPSNSKLISGPSGIVNQSTNNSSVNVPVGMISGTSGGVSTVIGSNNTTGTGVSGPNNIPIIPSLSGGGNGSSAISLGPQNNRGGNNSNTNNNMMSVSSGGLGSRNISSMCRQIGSLNNIPDNMMGNNLNDFGIMMGSSNHNGQHNQQSIMNSIMSGGGGPMSSQLNSMGPGSINQCGPLGGNTNMMIGSGQKNIMGGIAQMEWNKLQHQYYEERTKGGKGSIDGMSIGELCNSSQNISGVIGPNGRQIITNANNNNLPSSCTGSGSMRQNSQNCQRSQGPPPPYHHTPRSASVPIATQSPNPGSPNNPTSNLSLPSPRTGGSTLNSPAGDVTTSSNNGNNAQQQCNKSQQLQYKQDSPSGSSNNNCNNGNGNSGTNNNRTALSHSSNPNTPISSHMSPNASLKDLELGNTSMANSNQDICDNNLMPAPSPEQVQNLNIFEEELTIQKHINRQNSFTYPLSPQTPNLDKNRMNTSGPSPQGPRTPSMTGEHSNPSSIDSRFPPASPNINFSPVTGQNNQNQSGSGGNVQQQIGSGSNNNQQKLQNFMDGGPGGLNASGKCSSSVNETTNSNFTLRTDNLPLNPHTNCPPPAKPSHFDPISSLAQMSQQLTNSVSNSINGGHPNNPGMMGGFPNHGGMGMSPGDMSIGPHGPGPDNLMGSGGMDPCSMAAMGISGMGGGGGNIGGPPGVIPGGQYVMHGVPQGNMSAFGPMTGIPPRSLSPKLSGAGGIMAFSGNGPPVGMQAHRMMGRPMIGPGSGNPYNGASIQVKASAPNTIQYLPARPQIGNNNPRAAPSLEFLQRFANPIPGMDNCQPNKMSGGGIGPSGGGQNMPSFYTNCNQIGPNGMGGGGNMNLPHGLDSSGLGGPDGNNSMINMNMIGPGINSANSMCGPMGQNIMMRGLRPPGQGGGSGMLRMPVGQNMTGSPGIGHHHHHHHHHHSFNNGPQNNTQQNDPSMFTNQMFGGGSGGPKVNTLNMLGGPNSSGGGNGGSQIPGGGGSIMQSETGQPLPSSLSGPGQSGGGNNGSGNTVVGGNGPNSGPPNNFKSQFVGPSTADPNYAQQYHNFQQQLYATSTRSQPGGPNGNTGIPGGPSSSNQSFFVPK